MSGLTGATPAALFAYTNRDVDVLNAELRQVRRARGEPAGPEVRLATGPGEADFSPGDQVQFTGTDKKLRIYNGNVDTITALDERTGRLTRTPLPQANAVIRRRAAAAGIATKLGNHSFWATGIAAYLENGGTLENAPAMANHASTRTTQLYDRRQEDISLDEVERIMV